MLSTHKQPSNTFSRLTSRTPPFPSPHHHTSTSSSSPTNNRTLLCLYTNATSLNSQKLEELATLADTYGYDVIFITETWFDETSAPALPNYFIYQRDRPNDKHGGVAIYVKSNINATEIDLSQLHTNLICKHSEQLWLELKLPHETLLISCIYRPPNNNAAAFNEIVKVITHAKSAVNKRYSGLIITGNFNLPDVKWHDDWVNSTGLDT